MSHFYCCKVVFKSHTSKHFAPMCPKLEYIASLSWDTIEAAPFECGTGWYQTAAGTGSFKNRCRRKKNPTQNPATNAAFSIQLIAVFQLSWTASALCFSSNLSAFQMTCLSLSAPPFCHCLITYYPPPPVLAEDGQSLNAAHRTHVNAAAHTSGRWSWGLPHIIWFPLI